MVREPIDDGTEATYAVHRMGRPSWAVEETRAYPPLLTRGQAARAEP